MAEYYSKEQLLESKTTTWCDMYDLEDFLGEIPSENILHITRCKDCEYWQDKNSKGTQGICLCGEKDMNYGGEFYPFANDFCSYGKSRTPQNDEVRE